MHDIEATAADIIDAALKLHMGLGPGLLESVYETILAAKLVERGHSVVQQCPIDIEYDGLVFQAAFRADIIVNGQVLVEVKSIERLNPVHGKQVLTYLRLLKQPLGLLINFGGATLKEGLRRIVNNYEPLAPSRLRVNQ
ncbi:GxxExxY protein [Sphingomonas psychrotolerans]|uniref:GxxExxY protein n=1 Tax=Sphingomonas psychrotolerans TaxID=1327635 RepID=A0A2K8MIE3_9SPHN|nr:GxxExxY protein [Sphingomonas psychrotolerans]ATY31519.1 GxxExxY protein [Sphingomonas psychrotolerans]